MRRVAEGSEHAPAVPAAAWGGVLPVAVEEKDLPAVDPSAPCPVMLTDTREQAPLPFEHCPTLRTTLQTGDYSALGLQGVLAVERKSIPDLLRSLSQERGRFMRELERMRGYRTRALLVVGTGAEMQEMIRRRGMQLAAVKGSLASIEAMYCPILYAATPEEAAARVEGLSWYVWRDVRRRAGVRTPNAPEWAREYVLRGMPAIKTRCM